MLLFSGCAPANSVIHCPLGFLWRDAVSCVRVSDCTCRSHSGKPVKVSLEWRKNHHGTKWLFDYSDDNENIIIIEQS